MEKAVGYRILCAYDKSAAAKKAFDFAVTLAKSFEASLHVVAVFQPPEAARGVKPEALQESAREQFSASFDELRERVAATGLTVNFATSVGYPAQQILHQAHVLRVEHIVVGHRGKSSFDRWSMGSVSQRVVTQATCPVTVVR